MITAVLSDVSLIHQDNSPVAAFTEALFRKTVAASEECDTLIRSRARNWSFDRIALIDRLILRLAITEFLHFSDIPPKVTIDEAVELAKKFSTGNSGSFVNGILDSLLSDLQKGRRIYKEGRGLEKQKQRVKGGGKK